MAVVKTTLPLNSALLTIPTSLRTPALREAGLAWLDMGNELWSQEFVSMLSLTWHRDPAGENPEVTLLLDSSKNLLTRELITLPSSPGEVFKRRERFDAALARLLARTSVEALWAAVVDQPLANLSVHKFRAAWKGKTGEAHSYSRYPEFSNGQELLFHLLGTRDFKLTSHPWLD